MQGGDVGRLGQMDDENEGLQAKAGVGKQSAGSAWAA